MATIIVDKFINLIGFDFTKESKDAFAAVEKGIKSLRRFAIVSAAALGGLGVALDRVAAGIDDQAKFARGIDVSFEKLQALQFAAQKAGVPVEELNSFLENLARTSASTLPGQYNSALVQLGVTAKDVNNNLKDPITLFLQLSDAVKDFPTLEGQEFGGRLGTSVKLTNLLAKGTDKIVKDMKEAQEIGGIIPESLTKQVAEFFDDSLLKAKTTLTVLTKTILVSFLPAISKVLIQFDKWIVDNEKILSSRIGDFIVGVSKGFENFGKVVGQVSSQISSLISSFSKNTDSLKVVETISLAVTSALLATSAAFIVARAPILLVGLAVTKVVNDLPDLENLLNKISRLFKDTFPDAASSAVSAFDSVVSAIERVLNELNKLIPFKEVLTGIKAQFDDLYGSISNFGSLKGVSNIADKALSQIGSQKRGQGVIQALVQQQESGRQVSLSPQGISSASNSTNNVTINVNGAGSPKDVAREVNNQLELSTATKTANPGFNRPRVS